MRRKINEENDIYLQRSDNRLSHVLNVIQRNLEFARVYKNIESCECSKTLKKVKNTLKKQITFLRGSDQECLSRLFKVLKLNKIEEFEEKFEGEFIEAMDSAMELDLRDYDYVEVQHIKIDKDTHLKEIRKLLFKEYDIKIKEAIKDIKSCIDYSRKVNKNNGK